jgi:hypothetical protein
VTAARWARNSNFPQAPQHLAQLGTAAMPALASLLAGAAPCSRKVRSLAVMGM